MPTQNINLPAGYVLSMVTDGFTTGSYARLADINYSHTDAPTSLSASSTTSIGPFDGNRRYQVSGINGDVTLTQTLDVLTSTESTALIRNTNNVADLTALGEANVADIANDANGTAIATAVNGILAILVAAGLMEAAV
jgi:hypothetical protein